MSWTEGLHPRLVARLEAAGITSQEQLGGWLAAFPEGNHIIGRVMRAELLVWRQNLGGRVPSPEFSPGVPQVNLPE